MDLFNLHLNKLQRSGMIEPYNNQSFIRRETKISLPKPSIPKEKEEEKTVHFLQPPKKEEPVIEEETHTEEGIISGTFTNIIDEENTNDDEPIIENTYDIPNFMEEFTRNSPRAIMVVEQDGTRTFYKSKLDYHQKTKKRIIKCFHKIGETTKIDKDTVAVAITRKYMKENS